MIYINFKNIAIKILISLLTFKNAAASWTESVLWLELPHSWSPEKISILLILNQYYVQQNKTNVNQNILQITTIGYIIIISKERWAIFIFFRKKFLWVNKQLFLHKPHL